jgi:hypothetical protein
MITKEMLDDWMMENGEDVMFDGPFDLTREDMDEYSEQVRKNSKIVKTLIDEGEINDPSEIDFNDLQGDYSSVHDLCLEEFAIFLNNKGFSEKDLE